MVSLECNYDKYGKIDEYDENKWLFGPKGPVYIF